jgi:beta-glucosidase
MPTGGDGPAGDVTGNGVAQSPAPIVLGATWSTAMAAQYGNELGQEARARNKSQINAPVLDLMRTWHQGRQAESFGEDPFLTGTLGAAEIPAIQQHHVEDMMKHIGAYTQETGRAGDAPTASGPNAPASFPNNEVMSLKTLNELYLAPFGAGAEVGASNIMCLPRGQRRVRLPGRLHLQRDAERVWLRGRHWTGLPRCPAQPRGLA